jgi:hypothetical protein
VLTVVLVWGDGDEATATAPPESIQGPQVRLGDLTYVITNVRVLDPNRPSDAPYVVNLEPVPKGRDGTSRVYFGVFLKVYNHNTDKAEPSAPGFLLEPTQAPGLVAQNQWSESPYRLDQGATVPAGGQLPIPGSASAGGPIEGGLLLYVVSPAMTKAQPFRLVVNDGTQMGAIVLPKMNRLPGSGAH